MTDLHTALESEVVDRVSVSGVDFILVRLRDGREDYRVTLHAKPTGWTSAGVQKTDLLAYLGLEMAQCQFLNGSCFAGSVNTEFDLDAFANAFGRSWQFLQAAETHLSSCGLSLPQPVGWEFFQGSAPQATQGRRVTVSGDGHRALEKKEMTRSSDGENSYAMTWIAGGPDKGWIIHYSGLSSKQISVLKFLVTVRHFDECPEFEFTPCHWRFEPYEAEDSAWRDNAHRVHGWFDAHEEQFRPGLESLLQSDRAIRPHGFRILPEAEGQVTEQQSGQLADLVPEEPDLRDVFLCHAGEDKPEVLEPLTEALGEEEITYWYDRDEILWGDSLTAKINEGLRRSRYVLVVLSPAFLDKRWPQRELNAALSRETSSGETRVLPLITGDPEEREGVLEQFPLLADKLYLSWHLGLESIIDALKRRLASDA